MRSKSYKSAAPTRAAGVSGAADRLSKGREASARIKKAQRVEHVNASTGPLLLSLGQCCLIRQTGGAGAAGAPDARPPAPRGLREGLVGLVAVSDGAQIPADLPSRLGHAIDFGVLDVDSHSNE